MRASSLKVLRDALIAQGVATGDTDVYVTQLMEPGAIEGAMSWYRAGGLTGAAVPAVDARTLYVWGTADATVGRMAAELTREYVRGPYRFVPLEGAGHFFVDQFPERTGALILEHIGAR